MWEQEIGRQLLGPIARRRYYAAHSVEGLLRGDSAARADFYGKGIKDGWLDVEEVRKLEDLPARPATQRDGCKNRYSLTPSIDSHPLISRIFALLKDNDMTKL